MAIFAFASRSCIEESNGIRFFVINADLDDDDRDFFPTPQHWLVSERPEWVVHPTTARKNDQPTNMTSEQHGLAHNAGLDR